ncbi:MAG: carboxypeptidase-like regulatory domain-containing protein [Bacteroidales bacterium]|nr:carboxypeptidase-like regulatory domain-containing protein [Bacteroidales bacterium]
MRKFVVILLLMNIICIRLLIAQNPILTDRVSIKLSDVSVNKALDVLSLKTGYYFSYDAQILTSENKITLDENNEQLKQILEKIFSEKINLVVIKNHIIISKLNADSTPFSNTVSDSMIQINGKIIDKKTKKPIPYASVGILNSTSGTVSNQNGEFSFRFPARYQDSTIYIFNLGYKNYETRVQNFHNKLNIIELTQEYVSIEEVIIRNADPKQILLNAILNIKNNYTQKPIILSAFYRESVKKNKHLFSYSEALLKIYKTPYRGTLRNDQIKIEKSRKIVNTGNNDSLSLKLKDGLYSSLNLDFIRNPISFFDENYTQYYNYRLIDIVSFNNSTAYVISFEQKKTVKTPLYKGKIYINNKNFAVIASEFEYNLKTADKNLNFVAKKSRKLTVKPLSAKYFINYKKINGKYIFNHVRADLDFKVRKKRSPFSAKYRTSFETVAMDYKTNNINHFDKKARLKRNQIFIDNKYEYDIAFWGSDNFISPEKSITEALKEIRTKINASE